MSFLDGLFDLVKEAKSGVITLAKKNLDGLATMAAHGISSVLIELLERGKGVLEDADHDGIPDGLEKVENSKAVATVASLGKTLAERNVLTGVVAGFVGTVLTECRDNIHTYYVEKHGASDAEAKLLATSTLHVAGTKGITKEELLSQIQALR